MQNRITNEEIQAAAQQLARSGRGREVMRRLANVLKEDNLDLDLLNQRAFLALLGAVWTGRADEVTRQIGAALNSGDEGRNA